MLEVNPQVKVYLYTEPMDMRKGFEGLSAVVAHVLKYDPLSGHYFLFRNRKGDRAKILHWDGSGLVLFYKRLDDGEYFWPKAVKGVLTLSSAELAILLEGTDWRRLAKPISRRPDSVF